MLVPAPFSIPWYWKIFLPVFASVMTCSWLGVPSFWKPPTTVSYARTGLPEAAQTTFLGATAAACWAPKDFAVPWAACAAAFGAIFGVVEATAIFALLALVVLLTAPPLARCTIRSPPRTGSPAKVRS